MNLSENILHSEPAMRKKETNIATAALPEPPGPALAALPPCSCSNGYIGEKEEKNLIKPYLNATSVKWTSPNKAL